VNTDTPELLARADERKRFPAFGDVLLDHKLEFFLDSAEKMSL
jgi:hypothetical protein